MDSDSSLLGRDMQSPDPRIVLIHFLRQIESRHARTPTQGPILLHWKSCVQSLEEYPWPLHSETGERVPPSDWEEFRRTHKFKQPCCLCAFLDNKAYTESRVGIVEMVTTDPERNQSILNGEYVAVCAEQRCGFLLCIERLYAGNGMKVKFYPQRAKALPPQQLAHITDIDMSFRRCDSLSQVMSNSVVQSMGRNLPIMTPRQARKPKETFLRELSMGIPESRFWAAFVQCMVCKDVVFRDTLAINHKCRADRRDSVGRYQPYSRPLKRSPAVYPALELAQGDVPAGAVLRSLRARSPAPTEIDDDTEDEATSEETAVEEVDEAQGSSPPPELHSDFELPTLLEVIGNQRQTRGHAASGGQEAGLSM